MRTLAASSGTSDVLGFVGYGGLAVVLTVVVVLACKHNKLSPRAVLITAFVAGSAYLQAGGIWRIPQGGVGVLYSIAGVGHGGSGPLGTIGPGAVALTIAVIAWLAAPKRKTSAVLGIAAAVVFAGSGGVWAYLAQMGTGVATQVGG